MRETNVPSDSTMRESNVPSDSTDEINNPLPTETETVHVVEHEIEEIESPPTPSALAVITHPQLLDPLQDALDRLRREHQSGRMQANEVNIMQIDIPAYLLPLIGGVLVGYSLTVLGGFVSQNQFLSERFHSLYERRSHEWFSVSCRYLNLELITFSLTPALAAAVPRLLFLMRVRFGNGRNLLMISYSIVIVGAIFTTSASLILFCFGLLGIGFGVGASSMVIPMYLSQVYSARTRDRLSMLFYFSLGMGTAMSSVMSFLITNHQTLGWVWVAVVISTLSSSLLFLSVSLEVIEIQNHSPSQIRTQFLRVFSSQWRPAFIISFATQVFSTFTGSVPAAFYYPMFFMGIGVQTLRPVVYSVILITLNFSGLSGSAFLFPRIGARRTVFASSFLMTVSLGAVVVTMYSYTRQDISNTPPIVYDFLVAFLSLYVVSYNTCFSLLGWLDVTYPRDIMFTGLTVSYNSNLVFSVIIAEIIVLLLCYMGPAVFLFFVGIIVLMVGFVYYCLPETYLDTRH